MAEASLSKTLHYGGRREAPTAEEIQAIAVRAPQIFGATCTAPHTGIMLAQIHSFHTYVMWRQ